MTPYQQAQLKDLNELLDKVSATIAMLQMMQGDTRMSEAEWTMRNQQLLRYIGWRPRDPVLLDRIVTRPISKEEARERTARPPGHPVLRRAPS